MPGNFSEDQIREVYKHYSSGDSSDIETFERLLKEANIWYNDDIVQKSLFAFARTGEVTDQEFGAFHAKLNDHFKNDAENRKQLQVIFDAIDADKNGVLDRYEIKMAYAMLGEPFTDEDVETLMSEADVEKKGRVTFDQFCRSKAATVFMGFA